jgi:hypothetical protein
MCCILHTKQLHNYKGLFSLGCCDFKVYPNKKLSITFVSSSSQSSQNSTSQALTKCNYESTYKSLESDMCQLFLCLNLRIIKEWPLSSFLIGLYVLRKFLTYEKFVTLIICKFLVQIQLSSMKCMFMQQETKLHFNCFLLDYCDHNNLMERYPKSIYLSKHLPNFVQFTSNRFLHQSMSVSFWDWHASVAI